MLINKLNQTNTSVEHIDRKKKIIADTISFKLSNKYSEYCSQSNTPIKPNFNMSNINGDILSYLLENELDITLEDLIEKIELLNISLGNKYNNTRQNKDIQRRLEKIHKREMKLYLFVESDNFTDKLNYV